MYITVETIMDLVYVIFQRILSHMT